MGLNVELFKLLAPFSTVNQLLTFKLWERTRNSNNFRYNNPFTKMFTPFESPDRQLSNGANLSENGHLPRKLWSILVVEFFKVV